MKVLLYLPLAVMFTLACFSTLGLGASEWGDFNANYNQDKLYYDSGGHAVCFAANLTGVGEPGKVVEMEYAYLAAWNNGSWTENPIYYDTNGQEPILYKDIGRGQFVAGDNTYAITTSLGFIGIVVGIMAFAVIVGVKVFGFGTSNSMVMVLGTAYLGIWGIFSVMGMQLILAMTLIGPFFYLALTFMYTLGIISSFSGTGED